MEVIRPSPDLRNHYNDISKQCREEKSPVIIIVNGRIDWKRTEGFYFTKTRVQSPDCGKTSNFL